MTVEMEALEPAVVGRAVDPGALEWDGVVRGRRVRRVHLEVLRQRVDAPQFGEEWCISDRRRSDDPRQEDGVGHSVAAAASSKAARIAPNRISAMGLYSGCVKM